VRTAWLWIGQVVLAAIVMWFVGGRLAGQWGELARAPAALTFRIGPIALAMVTVLGAYALLIAAWNAVLRGWGANLAYSRAARIWCLSNLGRYIPGKVWSVAGLAVLAQREGATGWAAAGSAIAMQALALGTGAVAMAVTLPGAPNVTAALIAGLVALAVVASLTTAPVTGLVGRLSRGRFTLSPLPLSAVVLGGGATLAAWVLYGLALWMLSTGMLAAAPPPVPTAIGVFAAGYIVGLIAIFAPGGVGVRELMLTALLGPVIGAGPAAALSVGSRLMLTCTELAAALIAVAIGSGRAGRASSVSTGGGDT